MHADKRPQFVEFWSYSATSFVKDPYLLSAELDHLVCNFEPWKTEFEAFSEYRFIKGETLFSFFSVRKGEKINTKI